MYRCTRIAATYAFEWEISVFAGPPIPPEDRQQLEQLARYIARPPVALEAIRMQDEGRLSVTTPPDPHTGATTLILDPLDWIHAVTALMF